jgi:hypothetical protein
MEHRGYDIAAGEFGLKEIKALGRGSVHKSLRGKFTHADLAKKTIDDYEDSKEKVKVDGKADSGS